MNTRYFTLLTRLYHGKEAYDPKYRHKLHVFRIQRNRDKLKFLYNKIKELTEEIHLMSKEVQDKERLMHIREEIEFLKNKIYLLRY